MKFPIGHGWSRKFGIQKFQLPGVTIIGFRFIPIGGQPVRWWGPSIYLQLTITPKTNDQT